MNFCTQACEDEGFRCSATEASTQSPVNLVEIRAPTSTSTRASTDVSTGASTGTKYSHSGCAALRTVQRGTNICVACGGRFQTCYGSYGYRNSSTTTWTSGDCPADLNCSPESPKSQFCTRTCENFVSSNRGDAHSGSTFSHPGCAALRPVQHGTNMCEACGGNFRSCSGSYGYRDGNGTKIWRSGECPSDLAYSPESPNSRFCSRGCENRQKGNPSTKSKTDEKSGKSRGGKRNHRCNQS